MLPICNIIIVKTINIIFKLFLVTLLQFVFMPVKPIYAASSPGLGEAASFAILAGTEITNVPTSVITGDVGLSPAAGSNIAGLTSAEVSGTIYAVDATGPDGSTGNNPGLVNQAKTDLITAYDALSAVPNVACDGADYGAITKDLVGLTLTPGVYCANAFELSGTLTLDAEGDANAVWIFRSAATLTTSDGGVAEVVFTDGIGSSCNVWWKVASSATLGTNTSFIGNILALTSIAMNTGASLNGRVLARNGAVTLQSNTINQSCTAPVTVASSSGLASAGPSVDYCEPFESVAPIIIDSRRVDSDSIFLSWGPYSGIDTFIVEYGTENGEWLYNTRVTGFSTTLSSLPANQPMWVRVTATDYCSLGKYGEPKLVGFPKLPNTGFGSYFIDILNYLKNGISFFLEF